MDQALIWWKALDYALNILHGSLILFVMFGWILYKTRRAHILVLGLVLASWIGLGYWYGFGYCLLTDVHWSVKHRVGETNLPSSFIAYSVDKVFGIALSDNAVAWIAYGVLILSVVMTIVLNIRDAKKKSNRLNLCCDHGPS